jgi:hypothetical protein
MRLKLPGLKGAPERAGRLARAVGQLPGVNETAVNPTTGSLLILFDPRQTGAEALIAFLKEQGEICREFTVPLGRPSDAGTARPHPLATLAWSAGSALGRELVRGALGHALRDTPWSILLAVV